MNFLIKLEKPCTSQEVGEIVEVLPNDQGKEITDTKNDHENGKFSRAFRVTLSHLIEKIRGNAMDKTNIVHILAYKSNYIFNL